VQIQSLIVDNTLVESKVQPYLMAEQFLSASEITFEEYFVGVGVFANKASSTDMVLASIHYYGGKPTQMW
jgi:hypothetical protein